MLLFKREHILPIIKGEKTETRRIWWDKKQNILSENSRCKSRSIHLAKTEMLSKRYFAKILIEKCWIEKLGEITEEGAIREGYPTRKEYLNAFFIINKISNKHQESWLEKEIWCVRFSVKKIHRSYFIHAGNFGYCKIIDSLAFMKSLPDKCIDLIFSDPPWGHEYDGKRPMGINAKAVKLNKISYNDTFDPDWNLQWFNECIRVAHRVVIAMGWTHFNWWVANTDPIGYHFLVFKNGQGQTRTCNHNAVHPLLVYGDFLSREKKFHWNFTPCFIPNGFLRDTFKAEQAVKISKEYRVLAQPPKQPHIFTHPSPKPFIDWYTMIKELKPTSLYDPFGGSCVIGEVAETLGIPWISTELNPVYEKDIQYRINSGIKHRENLQQENQVKSSQQHLTNFIQVN